MSPVSIFTVVLFPAPLGPRYPRISPGLTVKLTWRTAAVWLEYFVRDPASSISGLRIQRLQSPFGADHADQILQPAALGMQHAGAEFGEAVIAAPRVVQIWRGAAVGLGNQVLVHQPLQRAVQRRRPEARLATGALEDLLHDAVAMLFLVVQ